MFHKVTRNTELVSTETLPCPSKLPVSRESKSLAFDVCGEGVLLVPKIQTMTDSSGLECSRYNDIGIVTVRKGFTSALG